VLPSRSRSQQQHIKRDRRAHLSDHRRSELASSCKQLLFGAAIGRHAARRYQIGDIMLSRPRAFASGPLSRAMSETAPPRAWAHQVGKDRATRLSSSAYGSRAVCRGRISSGSIHPIIAVGPTVHEIELAMRAGCETAAPAPGELRAQCRSPTVRIARELSSRRSCGWRRGGVTRLALSLGIFRPTSACRVFPRRSEPAHSHSARSLRSRLARIRLMVAQPTLVRPQLFAKPLGSRVERKVCSEVRRGR